MREWRKRVKDKARWWKKEEKEEKKEKEWDGKRRRKGRPLLFFCFPFSFPSSSFLFRRHSFASIHFPPLSALFRSRSTSSHSVFLESPLLLWAKFNLPFSIPGIHSWEMENRCSKHVAGPRNSAKIEDTPVESFSCVIRYRSALFCTDLRSTQILIFLLRVIWRTH